MSIQKRNSIAGIVLHQDIPSRDLKRRWITPGVIVNGVKIASLIRSPAVHVVSQDFLISCNISSRISNWNLPISSASNILLHIPHHGFDIRRTIGVVSLVDDFVPGNKSKNVCVVGESINCGKDALQVNGVI